MNEAWTIPQTIDWSITDQARKSWDHRVPYYLRFRDHFASMIEAGMLAAGNKLPPERVLAEKFSITRVTVRQALSRMEAEGLIFREERRGWFVSPPRIRYDPTANTSFTESIAEQGRVAGTSVLSKQQIAASQWESAHLGCAMGDLIYAISRLRTVDGRAVLVEQIHIKAERCPGLLDFPLDQSMTDLLSQEYGIIEHRTQINMRPTALSEVPAKALGVSVGTPSLYLSRANLDQYDEVVEFDQEFWRHDAIDICVSVAGRCEDSKKRLGT
jgi:DNA-binding GntR family transcriptional regulator